MEKKNRPETLNEARSFESVKNNALAFGLCLHCSSRLAWGHQNGFSQLEPPCEEDSSLVETLPAKKQNGWSTVAGRASSSSSWPSR